MRIIVSLPNSIKIRRNKKAKSQISQLTIRIIREKIMSLLKDDALNTRK